MGAAKAVGVQDVYQRIDLLDGCVDGVYNQTPIYETGIYAVCHVVESARRRLGEVLDGRVQALATLPDGRTVDVSCPDHVRNLKIVVDVLKKILFPANMAFAESTIKPGREDIDVALSAMPDEDKQLYSASNILESVMVGYIYGRVDSTLTPAKATEMNIDEWMKEPIATYFPNSWLTDGKIDKTKVFHGVMDVCLTLGVDSKDVIPADYSKGYTPKKIRAILRRREIPGNIMRRLQKVAPRDPK